MKPAISVSKTSNSKILNDRLKALGKRAVYVGIPATNANARATQLAKIALGKGKRASRAKSVMAASELNNAEILYAFTKGSHLTHTPPRPVIEPAIAAEGNKEAIAYELALSTKAALAGDALESDRRLKRAGMAGSNAAKAWFTDSRNGWAPNAQRTIDEKGSNVPGIDTGAMRQAITYVTKDES